MRVISVKKLREFWEDPGNPHAEEPLRAWYQTVRHADWENPADVRATYNTADFVGSKVVFNIGGNKYRLVAVIDYERHKVFIRHVLSHKDYDKGHWKRDPFGDDWKKGKARPGGRKGRGRSGRPPRGKGET